jgi:adenosylcobinamide kinase / adenosylcobinamide-phosphate guanylyltransferase
LVLGGIRSGKSRWAESEIATSVGPGEPVCYVATGPKTDTDTSWSARIAAHRVRRPAHWSTVETHDVATFLRHGIATPTVIDDLGGWLVAALDSRGAWTDDGASVSGDIDELLDAVKGFGSHLVVVSPEVGLAVVPATASGRRFADELGAINQRLADICDRVVLVVAGQAMTVKEPDDRQ